MSEGKKLRAYREDGTPVSNGDTVTSFRGEPARFVMATRARAEGHTGKIIVIPDEPGAVRIECYDTVYSLTVRLV